MQASKAETGGQYRDGDAGRHGTARKLAIGAGLASLAFAGFAIALIVTPGNSVQVKPTLSTTSPAPAASGAEGEKQLEWVAAAPGRVEPRSGQIRIAAAANGTVVAVLAAINDKVAEGEVLIRLEDREARARLAAAEAEAATRKREREAQTATAGRADVTLAETMLDHTRIRAPIAGTILQVNAKVGELVVASPDQPLVVMGDMSLVRVRAEVDEQDVGKLRIGQRVFVRNTAYPGRDFEGKVAEMAPSLALPRMGSRGARRPTDVEVMEVVIHLDGAVPLLPGMRVDAFFRR